MNRRRGYAEQAAMKKGKWYVEERYEDKIRKVKFTHYILETIVGVVIGFTAIAVIAMIYNALVSFI